jgi:hypothetical protein
MPEQHDQTAPTAGEPQNTSGNGTDPAPASSDSTPDLKALLNERFDKGFGRGADRGRKDRDKEWAGVLAEHGLPGNIDELRDALESRQQPPAEGQPPADVEQSPQYQELAKKFLKLERTSTEASKELETMRVRADQARLDKFARAAMAQGVSKEALEYFVPLHQANVRMTEEGKLVVLRDVNGTKVESEDTVEDYIKAIVDESKFLTTPGGKGGAGSQVTSVTDRRSPPRGDVPPGVDVRPFAERYGNRSGK